MLPITHDLTLDFTLRPVTPRLDMMQHDSGSRELRIRLTRGGESWQPEGVTPAVAYRKPDGTSGLYDTLPDGSAAGIFQQDTVTLTLAPQVLTCPGRVEAALVLTDGDLNRVSSFPFEIQVAADPAAGQPESENYYHIAALSEALALLEAQLGGETRLVPGGFTEGKYIYGSDGRETSFAAYSASDYLDVRAYQGRSCTVRCYLRDYCGFAFYDENKVYIRGVNGNQAATQDPWWAEYPTVIPQNAAYIRYTVRTADGDSGYVAVGQGALIQRVEQLENAAGQIPYAYALDRILCIGDSLTNGAYYSPDRTDLQIGIGQSYPYYLSRMLRANATNAGFNGYKASDWWQGVGDYDLSLYDSFILWLGTNGGFTDTLDTDVTPFESPADYAETETGCLCKLIEKLRADSPGCFLAIGTVFASTGSVEESNTVIRKVAEKYGMTVIDFSDLTAAAYPQLHNGLSNCHFNKAGNIYIANRIARTLNAVLNADPMGCEFGLTEA